jgi:hypothetical protein
VYFALFREKAIWKRTLVLLEYVQRRNHSFVSQERHPLSK